MRILACLLLLAFACAVSADPGRVQAYVYDLDSDRYLYTEVHEHTVVDGKVARSRISYVMPDGKTFGHKTIDYSTDEFVPLYRLDMTQEGYAEGIAENGKAITMMRQPPRGAPEAETLPNDGLMAADAGLLRLLQANFDALSRGEVLQFRVLAPSRLDAYKFRAKRIADTTFEGQPASRIQVDMDSMLKLFAGPLIFTFGPDRKLREFRGPTNVRDPATGKDYHVRLAFYSKPPPDAPKAP